MHREIISENRPSLASPLEDSRIKALKSLAGLLIREVEQFEVSTSVDGQCLMKQDVSLTDDVQNYEAQLIRTALLRCGGHQRRAAQMLGIKCTTLHSKIRRYGIESDVELAKTCVSEYNTA